VFPEVQPPESWLTVDLRVRFRDRILTVDVPIAEPVIDGLLAATAVHHDLMLVARDDTDVSETGSRLSIPGSNPNVANWMAIAPTPAAGR
jgi:hypothetical protein